MNNEWTGLKSTVAKGLILGKQMFLIQFEVSFSSAINGQYYVSYKQLVKLCNFYFLEFLSCQLRSYKQFQL